jgi:MoaA/NifB/PqqE/SkfB family radical SAM enzyme
MAQVRYTEVGGEISGGDMIDLDGIGFYTLSNNRAKNVSWNSDLQRCELIITDRCNFKCLYCRGIKKELQGDISFKEAANIVDLWTSANLHNIRFSGGEPTIWKGLVDLIKYTKAKSSINHIAISTNGSASIEFYKELLRAGVNDFSISLDACCASTADVMSGVNAQFDHISEVVKYLSGETYCTVGVVLDDRNIGELYRIISYASSLGVSDIRIIPCAQDNRQLRVKIDTNYPILKYRINNLKKGRNIRGLSICDAHKCHLVKDDMVILHEQHFPCVIYMREQGAPIGTVNHKTISEIREERKKWFDKTDCHNDPICKNNCLDVCIDHNNKVAQYQG